MEKFGSYTLFNSHIKRGEGRPIRRSMDVPDQRKLATWGGQLNKRPTMSCVMKRNQEHPRTSKNVQEHPRTSKHTMKKMKKELASWCLGRIQSHGRMRIDLRKRLGPQSLRTNPLVSVPDRLKRVRTSAFCSLRNFEAWQHLVRHHLEGWQCQS